MSRHEIAFPTYALDDRYALTEGRVFLTGTQALVRIMLDQARRDRAAGLNTAGFVSGYRGSPLGAVDMEMWRARDRLAEARIDFLPAVNEDLGATAVLGAQQAALNPAAEVEGVFSMWYGKGPGVDRSGDALRHGNAYGSAPRGGVLVVAGDDHGCVSSSMPHQSEVAFMAWFMPTLNPANVAEYLSFGEYGIALSRYSGTWVGFKAISETVESGQSVDLPADRAFGMPDLTLPPGGLHVRTSDLPSAEIETRIGAKLKAVRAFVEANPIDRAVLEVPDAQFGFVTTGKGHLDLMEALRLLGLDAAACRRLGIDIYKVGMVWPLSLRDALRFVQGKREILVIEEKRGIIESQFKEYFYDWPGSKPERMVGKYDEMGVPLVPWTGELSPRLLLPIVAARLHQFFPDENLPERARRLTAEAPPVLNVEGATRTPYFCSGCPHNSSTKVPEGSVAASGIGCHVMASWMNRNTVGYAQMGGEGVPHVAAARFAGNGHIFQNLGEGTWYHSGSLAIRQAVAAGTNITYKILYNDAVAMTGGQPVDGPVSVPGIAWSCRAEGVKRIAVVSDKIGQFRHSDFPDGTTFHDRAEVLPLQRELREVPGVSVFLYAQVCATEKRRRRKRGKLAESPVRVAINPEVCEGCGDCSVESNCLSVEPLDTSLGRKRRINQASCTQDLSCLNGFCPSFVTLEGGARRKREADPRLDALLEDLPAPEPVRLDRPFDLLVTGVGGTGVITVGALITMAAHLEGKGSSVLDFTGFAQKFGTVLSYVRLAPRPEDIAQVRIEARAADAVIGCDVVVSSAPKASMHYRPGTRMVLNTAAMPTGDVVLNRDADLRIADRVQVISGAIGAENLATVDANAVAEALLGDPVFANVMLLGMAWQGGLVPVSEAALGQAIRLNGVAVDANLRAFALGRALAVREADVLALMPAEPAPPASYAEIVEDRVKRLTAYQDAAYAARYRTTLERFAKGVEDEALRALAARSLYKLMAYKDEYEVARLHSETGFHDRLAREFEGVERVSYHMAPPIFARARDARGRPKKRRFGPWMGNALRWLAKGRRLRGTAFDPFGYMAERREMRALIGWYEAGLKHLSQADLAERRAAAETFLAAPLEMRGFGPVWQTAVAREKPKADRALAELPRRPESHV